MLRVRVFLTLCLILVFAGNIFGADVILNEYNAVGGGAFLNGGNSQVDNDGGRASDSYFGRVTSNGGDWFELVVITDHLNMCNWMLDIYNDGSFAETLILTDHSIWSDLRSGTIITVSEDVPSDISYNPPAGDWWINVQANNNADGFYITASNFAVHNEKWQLKIRNSGGADIFGPAGEGVSPASGVGPDEIFRLETAPDPCVIPASADYDDGDDFSTFGSPNRWGRQNFSQLRIAAPESSTLTLLSPNGFETIMAGTDHDITWNSTGSIREVLIEFSIDSGQTWSEVRPANIGNTGSYSWLVPIVDSEYCIVRISSADNLSTFDMSNLRFTIYECILDGDLTGDCIVNMADLAVMAAFWLECENPSDPSCSQ